MLTSKDQVANAEFGYSFQKFFFPMKLLSFYWRTQLVADMQGSYTFGISKSHTSIPRLLCFLCFSLSFGEWACSLNRVVEKRLGLWGQAMQFFFFFAFMWLRIAFSPVFAMSNDVI